MTEFWASKPKTWCEMCDMFVRHNEVKKHNEGPKHKRNMERRQRNGRTQGGQMDDKVARELARMERMAGSSVARDVASGRAAAHEAKKTFADRAPPPRPYTQPQGGPAPGSGGGSSISPYNPSAKELESLWERRSDDEDGGGDDEADKVERETSEEREIRLEEEEAFREAQEKARRQAKLEMEAYDPQNPFGQWVEASPPREAEPEAETDALEPDVKKSRTELLEEKNAQFQDEDQDVEEDADGAFELKRNIASSSAYSDAVVMYDEPRENVAFKAKTMSKKRNARKKSQRDINE